MQARTWAAGPNLRPLSPLHLGRQHKISAASVEVHPVQLGDVGGSGNGRFATGWWVRSNVGGPEEEEDRFSLSKVSKFARAGMLSIGGDACEERRGEESRRPLGLVLILEHRLDRQRPQEQEQQGCHRLLLDRQRGSFPAVSQGGESKTPVAVTRERTQSGSYPRGSPRSRSQDHEHDRLRGAVSSIDDDLG